jgi:predicted transcriptional regulator
MTEQLDPSALLEWTSKIAAAHVSKNSVAVAELTDLVQTVYRSLHTLANGSAAVAAPEPAVPVRRSVFPDYVVCLEDGKKLKMLRRYLKNTYNMTPEEYRRKWGLPADYPMVAPSYARHRSQIAKKIGLGRNGNPARNR